MHYKYLMGRGAILWASWSSGILVTGFTDSMPMKLWVYGAWDFNAWADPALALCESPYTSAGIWGEVSWICVLNVVSSTPPPMQTRVPAAAPWPLKLFSYSMSKFLPCLLSLNVEPSLKRLPRGHGTFPSYFSNLEYVIVHVTLPHLYIYSWNLHKATKLNWLCLKFGHVYSFLPPSFQKAAQLLQHFPCEISPCVITVLKA